MRKLAILHAKDPESLAALDSAERTMGGLGVNLVAKSALSSGSLATSVDQTLAKRPESVLLISDASAAKLGKSNVYMLEGYIAAWAYTEALRKAGKEPTRAKLHKALDTLQELNLGGFRVHFDGDRVGSKLVELSLIDSNGRVRE